MLRKNVLIRITLLVVILSGGLIQPLAAKAPTEALVRIAILQNVDAIEISIRGQYEIKDPATGEILKTGRNLRKTKITLSKTGLKLGDEALNLRRVRFEPSKDVTLRVKKDDRRYRGMMDIVATKNNRLLAINVINLEDYIRGVLYHEVSPRWPLDTIMSQAVAARSYALYHTRIRAKQPYDLTNDVYSQVYGGRSSERFRTNLAVDRTQGEILTYKGKVLPAYFHSDCGGHTEDVRELWWKLDLPPLRGKVCEFCRNSPYYRWKKDFQSAAVQKLLNESGYQMGLIKEIQVTKRSDSGRVKELTIIGRDNKSIKISAQDFRELLGPNVLKSNRYDIKMKGYFFDILGQGWGHGVGLCQWGAYSMANRQYDYKEILGFYYPGAELADYRKLTRISVH